jgi:CDP-glucose 4,6-dehydratase
VRHPQAIRPWQHVLEPLAGYLSLAHKLWEEPALAGAYNFGPETSGAATVREVVELARTAYGGGEVIYGEGNDGPYEAGLLALEVAKARALLAVEPKWSLEEAVRRTMVWYRSLQGGSNARSLCEAEIAAYEVAA